MRGPLPVANHDGDGCEAPLLQEREGAPTRHLGVRGASDESGPAREGAGPHRPVVSRASSLLDSGTKSTDNDEAPPTVDASLRTTTAALMTARGRDRGENGEVRRLPLRIVYVCVVSLRLSPVDEHFVPGDVMNILRPML